MSTSPGRSNRSPDPRRSVAVAVTDGLEHDPEGIEPEGRKVRGRVLRPLLGFVEDGAAGSANVREDRVHRRTGGDDVGQMLQTGALPRVAGVLLRRSIQE